MVHPCDTLRTMPKTAALPTLSRAQKRAAARASSERNDGRDALTIPLAAKYLGVSERTMYRLVQRGDVRSVRPSGSLRFRPADLDAYLDSHVVS